MLTTPYSFARTLATFRQSSTTISRRLLLIFLGVSLYLAIFATVLSYEYDIFSFLESGKLSFLKYLMRHLRHITIGVLLVVQFIIIDRICLRPLTRKQPSASSSLFGLTILALSFFVVATAQILSTTAPMYLAYVIGVQAAYGWAEYVIDIVHLAIKSYLITYLLWMTCAFLDTDNGSLRQRMVPIKYFSQALFRALFCLYIGELLLLEIPKVFNNPMLMIHLSKGGMIIVAWFGMLIRFTITTVATLLVLSAYKTARMDFDNRRPSSGPTNIATHTS